MASTRKPVGINFDKMLLSLKDDIQGMVEDYEEMNLPINDDSEKLRRFCERLEFLLKFGLKERSLVLGGRKDLWPYLCRCLEERRNIQDGITLVKANKELKTNSGRHRYFLRYCLLQRCLADVLQQCVADEASTLQFYDTGSLLLQPHFASDLVTSLYVLSDLTFDLALASSGHDLDVCWPAYARVGGASPWSRPPSRTWSLSSLCSSSSMAGSLPPAGDATLPSSPRKSPGSSMASPSSPVTSSSSFAAADDDVVVGVVGNDVMVGGAGNDVIVGGAGNNVIVGGAGNDVIVGGVRSDVMVSGVGSDVMVGGVGNVDLITSLRENLAFLESDNAYLRQRLLKAGSPVRQREGERGGEEEEEAIKEGGERGEEEKGEKERENEKKGEKEREEGCQRCQRLLSEREMLADQIAQLEIQLEKLTKEGGKKEEERREGREEETKGEEEKEGKESKEDEEGRREVKREEEEEEKENESEEGRREEKRTQVTRTEEREVTRAEERTQTNPRASDSGRSLEIQIIEMERKLNKKVALLSQREKDCSAFKEDLESLREKYEERENGLRIANERVAQERQQKAASRISSLEGDRRRLEVALEAREREGEERREKEREREKREEEKRERGRLQEEKRKRTERIENEKLDLLEENGNLREENGNLKEENGNLYKENGNLREENGNLREENGNLKEDKQI